MSESLSNMFKDIDKSLDNVLSSDDDDSEKNATGEQIPEQSEHRDPPEVKTTPVTKERDHGTRSPPSKLGKNDDMDLSQRSKFMAARGKWSDRGRTFGKEEYQRSRSLDDSKAAKHAKNARTPMHQRTGNGGKVAELLSRFNNPTDNSNTPRRSKSLDNTRAKDFAQSQRKTSTDDVESPPRRSRSKERSRAQTFAQKKNSNENTRSRSKERSKANAYADSNRRSRSRERSGANEFLSQRKNNNSGATTQTPPKGRSRSRERSGAATYATKNAKRSASQERTASSNYAKEKDARRGRSKERSGAKEFASSGKVRPKSLEQTGARGYAENSGKARPSRSLERSSAGQHASSKRVSGTTPKGRSRSFDASKAKNYASDRGKGTPKTRSRSYDSSKANEFAKRKQSTPVPPKPSTIITKNPDGSVVVAKKRRREDGATVTTKTKYANIALARKHGIRV